MRMQGFSIAFVIPAFLLLAACAGEPAKTPETEPLVLTSDYALQAGLIDERGRFRQIFCAVLDDHGSELPDYRSCEEALTEDGVEGGATDLPVNLGQTDANYLVLLVPGLGWECFAEWLDHDNSGPKHVARFGYDVRSIEVSGLAGTENNARQIRDHIANLPSELAGRPIILMGYSKGAPDILTAVANYPEIRERVKAVVSIAGSVGGSPLADDASQSEANLLTRWPGSECKEGTEDESGAVASMRTAVRMQWLADNELPQDIHYYSVITYPDRDRVSWGLRNGFKLLSDVDIRNDTQVLIYDQMIPGSTLVAYANADHWAIAVPVARQHEFVGNTFVNKNDYPREAFLESLLRFLEEDLAQNLH
jgi:hypothetical protein